MLSSLFLSPEPADISATSVPDDALIQGLPQFDCQQAAILWVTPWAQNNLICSWHITQHNETGIVLPCKPLSRTGVGLDVQACVYHRHSFVSYKKPIAYGDQHQHETGIKTLLVWPIIEMESQPRFYTDNYIWFWVFIGFHNFFYLILIFFDPLLV